METKKAKPNPWPRRIRELQRSLGLDNRELAQRLGIQLRNVYAWKYGERQPGPSGRRLLELLEAGKF